MTAELCFYVSERGEPRISCVTMLHQDTEKEGVRQVRPCRFIVQSTHTSHALMRTPLIVPLARYQVT